MTLEETNLICLKIHGAYASQDRLYNSTEFSQRVNIWNIYFKDFTYKTVNKAVEEWISTQKTMPQISELLPRCKDLRTMEQGSLKDAANLRPTHELIYEAKHGPIENMPVPEWIQNLTTAMLREMLTPPKNRRKADVPDMGSGLPYEI